MERPVDLGDKMPAADTSRIIAINPLRVKAYCGSMEDSNLALSVFLKDHPEFEYASLINLSNLGLIE